VLILLVLTNLNCFSQIGTENRVVNQNNNTDTNHVVLSSEVAKKVIKDIIKLDGCILELEEMERKLMLLQSRETLKDSIIELLIIKDSNNTIIIGLKDEQLQLSNELIESLKKERKRRKLENMIFKIGTIVGIISTSILIGLWL